MLCHPPIRGLNAMQGSKKTCMLSRGEVCEASGAIMQARYQKEKMLKRGQQRRK